MVVNNPHPISYPQGPLSRSERNVFPAWVEEQLKTVVRQLRSAMPGGSFRRSPYGSSDSELEIVERALMRLTELDPQLVDILKCRAFSGMSDQETAVALGLSSAVIRQDWRRAKLWFYRYLQQEVASSISAPC